MKRRIAALAAAALFTSAAIAAVGIGGAQQSGQLPPHPMRPHGGPTTTLVDVSAAPISLEMLIRMSPLIVDGTVSGALPTINTGNTGLPNATAPLAETHSIVSIGSVLKGAIPNNSPRILVSQLGGNTGTWNGVVDGDPLMAQGDRYILFLVVDDRKTLPNTSGMPRYCVVGVWSGKAQVLNGKVQFLPHAHSGLHKYDGSDAGDFMRTIKDKIDNPVIPTTKLPIHPGGPKQ